MAPNTDQPQDRTGASQSVAGQKRKRAAREDDETAAQRRALAETTACEAANKTSRTLVRAWGGGIHAFGREKTYAWLFQPGATGNMRRKRGHSPDAPIEIPADSDSDPEPEEVADCSVVRVKRRRRHALVPGLPPQPPSPNAGDARPGQQPQNPGTYASAPCHPQPASPETSIEEGLWPQFEGSPETAISDEEEDLWSEFEAIPNEPPISDEDLWLEFEATPYNTTGASNSSRDEEGGGRDSDEDSLFGGFDKDLDDI
jgi:hypothetical protein